MLTKIGQTNTSAELGGWFFVSRGNSVYLREVNPSVVCTCIVRERALQGVLLCRDPLQGFI